MSNRRFSNNGNARINNHQKVRNIDNKRNQIRNIPNLLNKSFLLNESLEKNFQNYPVKSNVQTTLMHRTSSKFLDLECEHCAHDHMQKCCMYHGDEIDDIARYASFKKELDEPYSITSQSEDFDLAIGSVTPEHFPCKLNDHF